jgi:uncharacterized membrane protein YvlD (DUF360 family)
MTTPADVGPSVGGPAPPPPASDGLRFFDLLRSLFTWAVTFLALLLTERLLPGFTATSWWPLAVAAAVAGVVGMIVRPLLVEVSAAIGWVAVAAATLVGQAVVMQVAMAIVPGASFDSFWTAVAAAWLTAAFATLLAWLVSAGTDDSFAASLLRIKPSRIPDAEIDGVVFVQLDGVSFPVMQWVLQSGTMPTLRRWVDGGSHAVHEWVVQLPCTTPASQQAILQGSADGIPAFRWYDRELGRVLVANRPADASIIEARASTGHGLLADDGISISNLFTGDAPRAAMTMSRMEVTRGSRRTRQVFARFLIRPDGLVRSISRTAAEVVRERFQALRQRRLHVHPRVHRSWTFAGLRAFSNCLLRDLNTALVSEEMMRGTRTIYVDYVDYDEIAHHAGAARIESLAALTGLDQVLTILERVASRAPRRYHLVLLSDHGQSQGEPFASRYGIDLSDVCRSLTASQTTGIEGGVEGWGRVDSVLEDLAGTGTTAVQQAASRRVDEVLKPKGSDDEDAELVVLAGGNLAMVYVPGPERLLLEEVEHRWPALVPGLLAHPGVGFVSALAADGPVALGRGGRRHLTTGVVQGADPLAPFGDHAPAMLAKATSMDAAPELYVNSSFDVDTMDVAAFEPLVGCHGGLGGWQDRGFVLAPPALFDPSRPILGGDELHQHLVGVLTTLGHRAGLGVSLP